MFIAPLIETSGPLHLLDHFVIRLPCVSIAPIMYVLVCFYYLPVCNTSIEFETIDAAINCRLLLLTTIYMPVSRSSQRKSKATVPKPARGSGLNPSGLPAADQLNIAAEQPTMSAFSFDPHQENQHSMQERWQGGGQGELFVSLKYLQLTNQTDQSSYDDMYASGASGDQFSQYDNMYASSSTNTRYTQSQSFGAQSAQPNPHLEDRFMQPDNMYSSSSNDTRYTQAQPFGTQSAPPQPHLEDRFTQPQPDGNFFSQDGDGGGTSLYEGYSYGQDQFWVTGDQQNDSSSLPNLEAHREPQEGNNHVHGTPLPPWVDEAPDRGVSVIDRGNGFIPPATNIVLIRHGEIAQEEVVHVSFLFFVLILTNNCTDKRAGTYYKKTQYRGYSTWNAVLRPSSPPHHHRITHTLDITANTYNDPTDTCRHRTISGDTTKDCTCVERRHQGGYQGSEDFDCAGVIHQARDDAEPDKTRQPIRGRHKRFNTTLLGS